MLDVVAISAAWPAPTRTVRRWPRPYAGDHTWRAYLSTTATETGPAVHARDRIGAGPWYNAEGRLIAANVERLHGDGNRMTKETATTERLDPVNGVGDTPNRHDILTGSRPDGTVFDEAEDLTAPRDRFRYVATAPRVRPTAGESGGDATT